MIYVCKLHNLVRAKVFFISQQGHEYRLSFILYFGGGKMTRVAYRSADVDLMARMMRAEAEGEGKQGMLYVGNVIVNRAVADCLDFNELRNIEDVIFQVQGGNYS